MKKAIPPTPKHIPLEVIADCYDPEIASLAREVLTLRKVVGILISWLPQSAGSPLRVDEAERLLNMLNELKSTAQETTP